MNKRKEPKTETGAPIPAPADTIRPFTIRLRSSYRVKLKKLAADRGRSMQDEMESALDLYMSESTAAGIAALSPFPDARGDELDMLATVLALLRSGPNDVRTILKTITRHFGATILKKIA